VARVQACLARIQALDRQVRAVVEVNPEARALAQALDRSKGPRGALHGLPILVKDNLDSADRMATTAGSLALVGAPLPSRDSHLVAKLRAAGAVLLGKTNLSEWANFRSTRSTSGWSGRGGQTRNPWALDRSPSGSSSGSAAAVAAGFCAAAIGTETDGSITSPASCCGVVGLKPTVGLVSRAGIIPISHTQDTAGPMTRSVRDAAILLGAIAGPDPRDPATHRAPSVPDYAAALHADALQGARLGRLRQGQHPPTERAMAGVWTLLKDAGAILVDVDLPTGAYERAELEVLLFEFKAGLEAYLATRRGPVRTLAQLIAFNRAQAERELPYFDQELLEQAEAKGGLDHPDYLTARATCRQAADGIDQVLRDHRLTALVAATGAPAWPIDPVLGDHFGFSCTTAPAVAGYPHLTVPAVRVFGLPVGLSFIGTAWSELRLLQLGHAFELRRGPWPAPGFRPGADLG